MSNAVRAAIIAGNEEKVIARCLRSIGPYVTRVYINCNGSDDTHKIAGDMGAHVVYAPWQNFAHNRNLILEEARGSAAADSYILVGLDADEELVVPEGWEWPDMRLDAYDIEVRLGESFSFMRTALVKAATPWRWEGVIHEGLYTDSPTRIVGRIDSIYIRSHKDGARRSDPNTAQRDLDTLIKAVADNPGNPRYQFYLAQQYRFCDRWNPALEAYEKRITMGGFKSEVWYSKYMIAYLRETVYRDPDVVDLYLNLFEENPRRAEPLWRAAQWCMHGGCNSLAFMFAHQCTLLPVPMGELFVDRDVYEWRCLDTAAAAGWYTPHRSLGLIAMQRLWAEKKFPDSVRPRMEANAKMYGLQV